MLNTKIPFHQFIPIRNKTTTQHCSSHIKEQSKMAKSYSTCYSTSDAPLKEISMMDAFENSSTMTVSSSVLNKALTKTNPSGRLHNQANSISAQTIPLSFSHLFSTLPSGMRRLFQKVITSIACVIAIAFCFVMTSCDKHQEPIDTQMKIGSILCTDGQTLDYRQYENSNLLPIGVVFYVNHNPTVKAKGYAVYLWDLSPKEFADTLGIEQGTSKDVYDFKGNENTFALQSNSNCLSPMAEAVFDIWEYGQSAYIPSVGQYQLLYQAKDIVNYYLDKCGGSPIENDAHRCWYWTSTEVEGQAQEKAWLFSLCNGTFQETPKNQPHKSRPIITIY